jgi:hypothetical protein
MKRFLFPTLVAATTCYCSALFYTRDVESVPVIKISLLDKNQPYQDTFRILKKEKTNVDHFAQKFFSSQVFSVEEKVLRLAGIPNPKSIPSNFQIGTTHLAWTCCNRNKEEILLSWSMGSTNGNTWFKTEENGNYLYFGSSLNIKPFFLGVHLHQLYSKILLKNTLEK